MNKLIHGLITGGLALACWFLWGMLHLTEGYMHRISFHPPAFTQLWIGFQPVFIILPILALAYCVYVWCRKADPCRSWVGFFAATTGALMLTLLPTLIAVWLPMVKFIEETSRTLAK